MPYTWTYAVAAAAPATGHHGPHARSLCDPLASLAHPRQATGRPRALRVKLFPKQPSIHISDTLSTSDAPPIVLSILGLLRLEVQLSGRLSVRYFAAIVPGTRSRTQMRSTSENSGGRTCALRQPSNCRVGPDPCAPDADRQTTRRAPARPMPCTMNDRVVARVTNGESISKK